MSGTSRICSRALHPPEPRGDGARTKPGRKARPRPRRPPGPWEPHGHTSHTGATAFLPMAESLHPTVLQKPVGCSLPPPTSSASVRPLQGPAPSPGQHLCPEPCRMCRGAPVPLDPFWGQSSECCAPAPFPPTHTPRDSARAGRFSQHARCPSADLTVPFRRKENEPRTSDTNHLAHPHRGRDKKKKKPSHRVWRLPRDGFKTYDGQLLSTHAPGLGAARRLGFYPRGCHRSPHRC